MIYFMQMLMSVIQCMLACLPAGHVLRFDKMYIWDTSRLQRGSNGTDTLAHLATFLLRVCGKNPSWYIPPALLYCFLSFSESSHPSPHTYARGVSVLCHAECALIGGHSVTGAGECGDEGVISSLCDR